jgi:hypothetical protein
MKTFLDIDAAAAARGDGLRPELRQLFERAASSPISELARRPDGMLQSGPDPDAQEVPERANVAQFPQLSARRITEADPDLEVLARLFRRR